MKCEDELMLLEKKKYVWGGIAPRSPDLQADALTYRLKSRNNL